MSVKSVPHISRVPTLLRIRGYEFFFRAGDIGEPPHVHVEGNAGRAKLWLVPSLRIAKSRGYSKERRAEIVRITKDHRDAWLETWSDFFER